ncbi:exopolyphosphatase/guanosine-5'-triphosphate,3'-diphosphate pyrophosphatase [Thermoflavifilum aggregans]|uniref:Exopolyphosphatase/guanosine-5'-triphosphate, 3'-diphosphate pyrophosphatase n=1 Tax=Thermoflavifilum aggregans TaxID=454188 RepID=A0A2M9CVY6_9BACT|nr:exopolyphosphatase [Thermoflavifilum aggregans]PJJ76059.1 exopolyphosphatase/guanosine-5'-triphosphate,3'-diphosphate pyrophosphatase [Thermoflavifilum aggregans]
MIKLAAIDVGSNAARLLIKEVRPVSRNEVDFIKLNLVRVPLRLGFDVFETGVISDQRTAHLIDTIRAYQLLMHIYEVNHYIACATSAMREAANGEQVIARVREQTGISLQIISGQQEASLIFENHVAEHLSKSKSYLYVDVGGGSTEISLFSKQRQVFTASFNIGTIRLLHQQITDAQWDELKIFLKKNIKARELIIIGSGGNINKIFSLSKTKPGKSLSIDLLKSYYRKFKQMTVEERMHRYQMREDRADVIVPALEIYLNIMRWSGAEEILVPQIGLADGLIDHLYRQLKNGSDTGK